MDIEVLFPGCYSLAKIALRQGEEVKAQSDAMVSMTSNVTLEGSASGGVMGMLKRTMTGESLFLQTLKAQSDNAEVLVAPSEPGDIAVLELNGVGGYVLQKQAYLASESSVNLSVVTQSVMKGIFSREGFFLQKATGKGKLIIASFGGILKRTLKPQEVWVVDNGHMVAWSDTVNYEIKKASSGWLSSLTSGEGFVCHVKGPGDVYIQSRNPTGFGAWVKQFIPIK